MLDDRERSALAELEERLSIDDPSFVQDFDRRQEAMVGHLPQLRLAALAIAVVLAVLLLIGSPAGALAVAGTVGVVWLMWRCSGHLDPRSLP